MAGGFKIELANDREVIARLLKLGVDAARMAMDAHEDCVEHVENHAKEGIANGPKSGRIYTTRFFSRGRGAGRTVHPIGTRPPHQASARGQYPASDTGNLMRLIYSQIDAGLSSLGLSASDVSLNYGLDELTAGEGVIKGEIGADAAYAIPLEYKDPGDGGRPFMRRAMAESQTFVHERFMSLKGRFTEGGA